MKFRALLFALGGIVWALVPLVAYAQLVPCDGLSCDLCSVGQLIQNVINFLVGISIPIAVAMFGWAGILMFAFPEEPAKREAGKRVFSSVFIGFILVLCGWLVVQTILSVLVKDDFWIGGKWNNLQCVDGDERARTMYGSVADFINITLGTPPSIDINSTSAQNISYSCEGYTGFALQGSNCVGPNGSIPATPIYTSSTGEKKTIDPNLAARITAACTNYGSAVCSIAQSISLAESSGGRNCPTSSTGAVGCMQVLARTACSIDPTISSSCAACIKSRISTSAACGPVRSAAAEPATNTRLGVKYIADFYNDYKGSCALTAAAYYWGPGNVQKANNTVPIPAVNYVAKVCGSN